MVVLYDFASESTVLVDKKLCFRRTKRAVSAFNTYVIAVV